VSPPYPAQGNIVPLAFDYPSPHGVYSPLWQRGASGWQFGPMEPEKRLPRGCRERHSAL